MESYGLSATLNQQEGLTQQDRADAVNNQSQINFNLNQFNNEQNLLEEKVAGLKEKVEGGLGGEVMDLGAKVKGLNKAREAGYVGTYDNLSKQAAKVGETLEPVGSAIKSAGSATIEGIGNIPAAAARSGILGGRAQSVQRFADYADRSRDAGQAEAAATEAPAAGDAAGAGTGAADTTTAAIEGGATGGEEGAAATTLEVVGEGASRLFGGAMGGAQLGLDIYKQVEGGSFFKGGINTGDDIGNITNEVGSVIDIMGAATGDPLLMLGGVGIGLIGSGISEISELFSKKKSTAPPTDATQSGYAPVAVQSLAAEGAVGATQGGSSLQAVQAGAS